jgi:excinuclease ABC subunit C
MSEDAPDKPTDIDLKELVKEFPLNPGVYLMKNALGKVIYVGKAKSLRARVKSYFHAAADHSIKTRHLVNQIHHIDYMLTASEVEAFLLEASLIKKFRPRYNIRLKDDKAYPYIRCSWDHEFPRFSLARRVLHDKAMYFGPYTSSMAVRETLRFLNRTFKIRDCTDSFFAARKRPCIAYQMNQCSGPCVLIVSKDEYRLDVQSALDFLKGRSAKLMKDLSAKMKAAAKDERFEAAARLRDSLNAMERTWEKQTVVSLKKEIDQDIIAYFGDKRGCLVETLHVRGGRVIGTRPHFLARLDSASPDEDVNDWLTSFLNQYYAENFVPDEILLPVDLCGDVVKLLQAVLKERFGKTPKIGVAVGTEGRKLLEMALTNAKSHFQDMVSKHDAQLAGLELIQSKLGLQELPKRIECYDISHFQGTENVASQVVFEDGVPKRDDYRRYRLRSFEGANDFAAMKEVLERRFKHTEYDDPQLVVVDGGKGQLSMAVEALKEVGRSEVPVVGLAKARTKGEFSDQEVKATEERFYIPGRQNPVTFPTNSPAFQILVGIRDEAHRFAITYHRKLREDRTLESALDLVSGLGPKRKKDLLTKFGSVEAIRHSKVEDLSALKGFNRVLAERILLQLEEMEDPTSSVEEAEESNANPKEEPT